MSSATSIDGPGSGATEGKISTNDTAVAAGEPARSASDATRDQFKPWHFFVLVSLIAATAAVVMARQSRPEHLVLISITIGAAGFAAAALYRMLWPLVSSDAASSVGPITGSMRAILEREKMLTLRAIKDLEFDRAMGKVSAADFDEMVGRLRARAITLMKQLDAGGSVYREMIERELQARVRKTPARRPGNRRRLTRARSAHAGPQTIPMPRSASAAGRGSRRPRGRDHANTGPSRRGGRARRAAGRRRAGRRAAGRAADVRCSTAGWRSAGRHGHRACPPWR